MIPNAFEKIIFSGENDESKLHNDEDSYISNDYESDEVSTDIEQSNNIVPKIGNDNCGNLKFKSINFLTNYERVVLLGTRMQQINNGSYLMIDLAKYPHLKSVSDIAEQELKECVIPFKIKRSFANGTFEIKTIAELLRK